MIILDENLTDPELRVRLKKWCRGAVHVVTDPEVGAPPATQDPHLLHYLVEQKDCVFVSVDKRDFYRKFDGQPRVCIVEARLGPGGFKPQVLDGVLRRLLPMSPFNQHATRGGIVARVNYTLVRYYRKLSLLAQQETTIPLLPPR